MPNIRDALLGVELDVAKGQRVCKRNSAHKIKKGEKCLVMRNHKDGNERSYCLQCAPDILNKAKNKIEEILEEMKE